MSSDIDARTQYEISMKNQCDLAWPSHDFGDKAASRHVVSCRALVETLAVVNVFRSNKFARRKWKYCRRARDYRRGLRYYSPVVARRRRQVARREARTCTRIPSDMYSTGHPAEHDIWPFYWRQCIVKSNNVEKRKRRYCECVDARVRLLFRKLRKPAKSQLRDFEISVSVPPSQAIQSHEEDCVEACCTRQEEDDEVAGTVGCEGYLRGAEREIHYTLVREDSYND